MRPDESVKKEGTDKSVACAHPSCKCVLSADRPHGKYCSEHCKEAAQTTELRCGCQHAECR
jgi:hypothetical protein